VGHRVGDTGNIGTDASVAANDLTESVDRGGGRVAEPLSEFSHRPLPVVLTHEM
jgi:hypothetical protein